MLFPAALALVVQVSAFPHPQRAEGGEPRSARVADLDGDGALDLVCVDAAGDRLVVARGVGDGRFGPPEAVATGPAPRRVRLADLTGDGRLDAVVAWGRGDEAEGGAAPAPGGLAVHAGRRDGGFGPARLRALAVAPAELELADLDLDGLVDAVVVGAAPGDGAVRTLAGRGGGELGDERAFPLAGAAGPLALGDLGGDARPELVVCLTGDGRDAVLVLAPAGRGTWSALARLEVADPADVVLGDVDGDGRADVVVAAGRPRAFGEVLAFPARADGAFAAPLRSPGGLGRPRIELVDLDGDGALDLLGVATPLAGARPETATVTVGWGAGDGTFACFEELPVHGLAPLAVAAGELDGRAGLDLAFARGALDATGAPRGSLGAVRQLAPRRFEGPRAVLRGPVGGHAVRCADLDGDGVEDVLALALHARTGEQMLLARRGLRDGRTGVLQRFTPGPPGPPRPAHELLGTGDLDGDGRDDAIVATAGGALVLPGDSGRLLGDAVGRGAGGVVGALPRCVADWDGDGADELAARPPLAGGLAFWGLRDGRLVERAHHPDLDAPGARAGDLDGDGRADLVHLDPRGDALVVRRGRGDFGFGSPRWLPLPAERGAELALADLDGDGRAELLALPRGGGEVWLFRDAGTGLAHAGRFPVGAGAALLCAGDLDGDGRREVLALDGLAATAAVLRARPDGTLERALDLGAAFHARDAALRRRGDGAAELLLADGGFALYRVLAPARPGPPGETRGAGSREAPGAASGR